MGVLWLMELDHSDSGEPTRSGCIDEQMLQQISNCLCPFVKIYHRYCSVRGHNGRCRNYGSGPRIHVGRAGKKEAQTAVTSSPLLLPAVPHKAVAEVSEIGNRKERLIVVNHRWQSEFTNGPKGGWSFVFWSGSDGCSGHLTTTAGCSVV